MEWVGGLIMFCLILLNSAAILINNSYDDLLSHNKANLKYPLSIISIVFDWNIMIMNNISFQQICMNTTGSKQENG